MRRLLHPRSLEVHLALLLTLVLFLGAAAEAAARAGSNARPSPSRNAGELALALDRLSVVGSALYVAAHPDDENTAMLAWLANERLVRTGYLSLTRGDGGQNLIGSEKGAALGVIRTQELLAARAIDGAEQFFTRAIDFGYSKSPAETFTIWNRDEILADVVLVIRRFRPDVIITRFPPTGEGGHGQHTASAILALEAFTAAADPKRFPEQLGEVEPWQPKRIFWNAWRPQLDDRPADAPKLLPVELGGYNPLLGRSYSEIAGESRTSHKSQGFGSAERRGSLRNYLELLAGEPPSGDPFDGIALDWSRIEGSGAVAELLRKARREFDPAQPAASIPTLVDAVAAIDRLPAGQWVALKRSETVALIRDAAGLWIEAIAATPAATPGSEVKLSLAAINRSDAPLRLDSILLPDGRSVDVGAPLPYNDPVTREVTIRIDPSSPPSQPYWLEREPDGGMYRIADPSMIGEAESRPALAATFVVTAGDGKLEIEAPVRYRWTDRVDGEQYRAFEIAPPVALRFAEPLVVFPDNERREVTVIVDASSPIDGTLALALPGGWRSSPANFPLSLPAGAERRYTFRVTPASGTASEQIRALLVAGDEAYYRSIERISYPHIPLQTLFPPAEATLVRVDVATNGKEIGYIAGSGDEVPDALRQIGYRVTLLDDEAVGSGDLSRFDAIVIGVRAFNTRDVLKNGIDPLLRYVERGGTVVAQYNTSDATLAPRLGPWPIELSRGRVTEERAPVRLLTPDHPLFTRPNRITAADFEGWVQERGLYFPGKWDARWEAVMASHDTGEAELTGGTLVTRLGEGIWIYTGYSFFRQLPAGVPGAFRLFANMLSSHIE